MPQAMPKHIERCEIPSCGRAPRRGGLCTEHYRLLMRLTWLALEQALGPTARLALEAAASVN